MDNIKIQFFGKVTSSVTHELQNVFAIIKETSGLMEDMLLMDKNSKDLGDKLLKILGDIKLQVNRGSNLTHNFNAFGHTTDKSEDQINLFETLKRLNLLIKRAAASRGVALDIDPGGDSISLVTDPVLFQTLSYLCIKLLINILPNGGDIEEKLVSEGKNVSVVFKCSSITCGDIKTYIESSEEWKDIKDISEKINSTLEIKKDLPGISIMF